MIDADSEGLNKKIMDDAEALRHLADLGERNHRHNHALYKIPQAAPIERIGIVGAGVMGSIVAASAITHGIPVVITDQSTEALGAAKRAIQKATRAQKSDSLEWTDDQIDTMVTVTPHLEDVATCPMIVESIVENVTTKRTFYSGLERLCGEETILVSNTSTLPIAELVAHLSHPERFCGLHYFPPIVQQKILEVIPGSVTKDATIAKLIQLGERLCCIPLLVSDGRGFLVNRVLLAYMNAGVRLLLAGIRIEAIESAALAFGMRTGPIRMYDEVGMDVALHCAWSFSADSEYLVARTPLLVRMIKKKQLGRKSGRGFFIHSENPASGSGDNINPVAVELIQSHVESTIELTPAQIQAAIILPMVIEATNLLEMGRAHSAWQIDLAVMCGIGFAMSQGGLLWWADQVGADRILEKLEPLQHLGPHLRPTQTLRNAGESKHRFYDSAVKHT